MYHTDILLGIMMFMPLSTIYQLYRGGQFFLLEKETGVSGENHRPTATHWQTLSYNVSSAPRHEHDPNSQLLVISTDCLGSCKSNYHTIMTTKTPEQIRVITKLPNSEQSYKGKVKTHKYINRQKSVNNRKTVKTVMTLIWYRHF